MGSQETVENGEKRRAMKLVRELEEELGHSADRTAIG